MLENKRCIRRPSLMNLLVAATTLRKTTAFSTSRFSHSTLASSLSSFSAFSPSSTRNNNFIIQRTFSLDVSTSSDSQTMTSSQKTDYPTVMTEAERYLFDLNGFLIIRNVLNPDEILQANDAIAKRQENMIERNDSALRNAVPGTAFYGSGPGRKDLGGVLEWGDESQAFKRILAHPRLVPLFHGILGKGEEYNFGFSKSI